MMYEGRVGIFALLWWIRRRFDYNLDHQGSLDWNDFFGLAPYNDNDVKRERRDAWRWWIKLLDRLGVGWAMVMLAGFRAADEARGWDEN